MKPPIFVKFEMANEFVNLFFEEIYSKPQYNGHAVFSFSINTCWKLFSQTHTFPEGSW